MIEHLRGRDRKLEPLGWTGQEAEWIALVCLHSGVFTRAQFCHYFDSHRVRAFRFVQTLVERRMAVESEWPVVNGGAKTCRISSKLIYQALGVENIRHRRKASGNVIMRRLLSLDFVLEHPGMNWLPTEPETVTFAYVDAGHQTDSELRSWGYAHRPLWDALRKKGRQVRVIGIAVENVNVDRTARLLEAWAAADPGKPDEGLTVKQEIKAIREEMKADDEKGLDQYGGFNAALQRLAVLERLPEAKVTEGVSIDDYSTWRAVRFADRDEVG